jgi:DNA-3-methyladenine glycosylase I
MSPVETDSEPVRCPWVGIADPEYTRYHDEEWGVPLADERAILEKLCLEGFQAGLSWLTILKKRPSFRRAFADFEPDAVARFGDADVERLLGDAGIVRHRGKIEAAIGNARACVSLRDAGGLVELVWRHAEPGPSPARHGFGDVPAETPASRALSKALKAAGFRFVGPTTVYAFMQSAGLVNDHLVSCHRHGACAGLRRQMVRS